jgi:hypothetical protein
VVVVSRRSRLRAPGIRRREHVADATQGADQAGAAGVGGGEGGPDLAEVHVDRSVDGGVEVGGWFASQRAQALVDLLA